MSNSFARRVIPLVLAASFAGAVHAQATPAPEEIESPPQRPQVEKREIDPETG